MTRQQIEHVQKRIGTTADGFWGPKSIAKCKAHLRAMMPSQSPWPKSDQSALRRFYGAPDDDGPIVRAPAPSWLRLYDSPTTRVKAIECHEKVAESLLRALEAAHLVAPDFARRYFGCHVDRLMRGGTKWSVHSYGAALDLAATDNGNEVSWPVAATMPIEVMECFAREGWTAAGAFWGRDAMHMQATQ